MAISNNNGMVQKILLIAATAMITLLGSLALLGSGSISRPEVEAMIKASEERQSSQMFRLEAGQSSMNAKLESLLIDQTRVSTKLDELLKRLH